MNAHIRRFPDLTSLPTPALAQEPQPISNAPLITAIESTPPSREEWDEIGGNMTPEYRFLTAHWFEAWGDHFLGTLAGWRGPLRYVTARDQCGRLLGVLPVATQIKARAPFLALGGYYVPSRGFPVTHVAADAVARALAQHLTEQPERVGLRLGPVSDGDPCAGRFIDALRQRGWRLVPLSLERRQLVELPATLAEYQATLSISEVRNIRRRERKMQREQKAEVKFLTTESTDNWDAAIADMALVEEQSWLPKRGGDLHFPGETNGAFWNAVLSSRREGLAARVWILYFEGAPVAYDFNIDSGSCRYSLFAHYAEVARSYRTGYLLMLYEVEDAIERGIRTIDLGAGDPGYKGFWGSRPRGSLSDVIAFPPGFRGAVLTRLATALPSLQRARGFAGVAVGRAAALLGTSPKPSS
jgi:Acetyltransferase (GNAT) domain